MVGVVLAVGAATLAACGSPGGGAAPAGHGPVRIVAGQSQYGNVAAQVGGKYVSVASIESNPDTDPHTYEVSPEVADEISTAQIVIQNGVGYDGFMDKVEAATPSPARKVISAQQLLGLPDDTPNPHLWYEPRTMPAVASRLAADLSDLEPAHAAYFEANAARFVSSLARGWRPSPRSGGPTAERRQPRRSRSPTTSCRPWASTTSRRSGSRRTS